MIKIPLPKDISIFQPEKIEHSPYELFYNWALEQLWPCGSVLYSTEKTCGLLHYLTKNKQTVSVSAFKVSKDLLYILESYDISYLIRYHKLSKKRATSEAQMRSFNISPASIENVDHNYIYVEEDYIISTR